MSSMRWVLFGASIFLLLVGLAGYQANVNKQFAKTSRELERRSPDHREAPPRRPPAFGGSPSRGFDN